MVQGIVYNKSTNTILLLERSGHPSELPVWGPLVRKVKLSETPKVAIKRIIREKTGIDHITVGNIAYSTIVQDMYGTHCIRTYLCETETTKVTLTLEHSAFAWADRPTCVTLLDQRQLDQWQDEDVFELLWNSNK